MERHARGTWARSPRRLLGLSVALGVVLAAAAARAETLPFAEGMIDNAPQLAEGVHLSGHSWSGLMILGFKGGRKPARYEGELCSAGRIIRFGPPDGLKADERAERAADRPCIAWRFTVAANDYKEIVWTSDNGAALFNLKTPAARIFIGKTRLHPKKGRFDVTGLVVDKPRGGHAAPPPAAPSAPEPPAPPAPTGPGRGDTVPCKDVTVAVFDESTPDEYRSGIELRNGSAWALYVTLDVTNTYPGMGGRPGVKEVSLVVAAGVTVRQVIEQHAVETDEKVDSNGQRVRVLKPVSIYVGIVKSAVARSCVVQ